MCVCVLLVGMMGCGFVTSDCDRCGSLGCGGFVCVCVCVLLGVLLAGVIGLPFGLSSSLFPFALFSSHS